MIALGGRLVVQGPKGKREVAMKDFVLGPFQSALEFNEIAIEAIIPAPQGVAFGGYLKLERRVGDFATASVAVSLDMVANKVVRAGIAMAGVGGKTIDATEAASLLVGQSLTEANIGKVAAAVAAAAQPRSDHRGSSDYKRQIIRTFVSRILTSIANSTKKAA